MSSEKLNSKGEMEIRINMLPNGNIITRSRDGGIACIERSCGETSLSIQWMMDFGENNELRCFQCETLIGHWAVNE